MASGDDVQLLTVWPSPYAMRIQLALVAAGVPFTTSEQDLLNKSPLLLQSNPVYKKIPVLLHHGRPVCESLVIIQYIDEAFPSSHGNSLLPKDPYDRAIARFWADFIDKKVLGTLYRAILELTGDDRKAAIKEVKDSLVILEGAFEKVSKETPFFGGANPGYVDVVLAPQLAWEKAFEAAGNFKFEFEKLPRLSAWKKAMLECPVGQQMPAPSKVRDFFLKRIQSLGIEPVK